MKPAPKSAAAPVHETGLGLVSAAGTAAHQQLRFDMGVRCTPYALGAAPCGLRAGALMLCESIGDNAAEITAIWDDLVVVGP